MSLSDLWKSAEAEAERKMEINLSLSDKVEYTGAFSVGRVRHTKARVFTRTEIVAVLTYGRTVPAGNADVTTIDNYPRGGQSYERVELDDFTNEREAIIEAVMKVAEDAHDNLRVFGWGPDEFYEYLMMAFIVGHDPPDPPVRGRGPILAAQAELLEEL